MGSACVFFALHPKQAHLSDINGELVNFYTMLKSHPRLLWRHANGIRQDKPTYYKLRALDPKDLDPLERAVRFLYLNRFCFNGLYRTNKAGVFNVPMGRNTGTFPAESTLYRASVALRHATITNEDFVSTVRYAEQGTVYYLDPPYDYSGRLDRGEYGASAFRAVDIPRLSEMLDQIDSRGARFVLSYINVDDIKSLAAKWHSKCKPVKRQIASFARFRKPIEELLISNFDLD